MAMRVDQAAFTPTANKFHSEVVVFICLIISRVVDSELVVGPPGGLNAVRAPAGLVLHVDQGAHRQLLKY